MSESAPIAVDLDGTLIQSDSAAEAVYWMWTHRPLRMLWLFLIEGTMSRARFKWKLYSEVPFAKPVFNAKLVIWLNERKQDGRKILLVSAAPQFRAESVAGALPGLFDEVVGSTQDENRRYKKKARWLIQRFGGGKFDYVGNSQADIPVWLAASKAYNVNPSKNLRRSAQSLGVTLVQLAESPQAEAMEAWDDWLRIWKWLRWASLIFLVVLVSCGTLRR